MKNYNVLAAFLLLPCTIFFPIRGIDDSPILSQSQDHSFVKTTHEPELLRKKRSIDEQAKDMLKKAKETEAQENSWQNILKQSLNPFNSINAVIFNIIPALYYKLKKNSHKLSKWWSSYTKRFSY